MTTPPLTRERVMELRELLKRGTRIDAEIEALCDAFLAQSGSVSVKSFDPVVLSMLLTAAENCAPVYRGSVLRAYDYIKALAGLPRLTREDAKPAKKVRK